MRSRVRLAAALLSACLVSPAWLAADVPQRTPDGERSPLRGIGVDERLDAPPVLSAAFDAARLSAGELPLFVRLFVRRADLGAGLDDWAALDSRLSIYAGRHVPVLLVLADPPADPDGIARWGETLQPLARHCRGKVAGYQVGSWANPADRPPARAYAYLLKMTAVQLLAADERASIVEADLDAATAAGWQESLYAEDAAAYLHVVSIAAPLDGDPARAGDTLRRLETQAAARHAGAVFGVSGVPLPDDAAQAAGRLLRLHLSTTGGQVRFTTCTGSVAAIAGALVAAASIKDVLSGDVVTLDERAADLTITSAGIPVPTLPHRLLYNLGTFSTYLVTWDAPSADPIEVRLHLASAGNAALRDPVARASAPLPGVVRDESAKTTTLRANLPGHVAVIDFDFGAQDSYTMRSEASDRAQPTAEEIVFRYQQADAAQGAAVQDYMAKARIGIHFQPTALDSYDIVVENVLFAGRDAAEWQEVSFTLNGRRFGRNRPPFPLLQPEKVLSLPLSLRFGRDYAYRLVGTERVGDRSCYVVAFQPIDRTRTLYEGRVWIDTERFVRLKVQAVQTRLSAPVVSNEEIQTIEPVGKAGDKPVYLVTKLVSRQIMTIAGRNLLVEKDIVFTDFEVNDPAFGARRDAARRGDDLMYRDTDKGLQHLVKRSGERVVSDDLTTNAKAFVLGAQVDPSFDTPLPLVGIDYLNFDFLNRGLQFGVMFSGVLAAGNIQKTGLGPGRKFDASLDFYGIAVKSNDQVFDDRGERKGERLQSRTVSTGVNVGYQATAFQKITGNVHVEYDQYLASGDSTSPAFVVPASPVTTSAGFNYEYRRGGYSLLGSWTWFGRSSWTPWGAGDQPFDAATRTYQKYNAGISKDFIFGALSKLHVNAGYYGGERLDRFSMYRSGLFDETRMRGVPSAGIRFSELALVRASYSYNLFGLFRLAAYLDHARGRTPAGNAWQPTTGIGLDLNLAGPQSTLLKFSVGKGFLPQIYRGSGSVVAEFLVFKPL